MKIIMMVLLLACATVQAAPKGLTAEDVYAECQNLGQMAYGIQMIRADGASVEQIVAEFYQMMLDEGMNQASAFAVSLRAREVARWVFAYYSKDWAPELVETTYRVQCTKKILEHGEKLDL